MAVIELVDLWKTYVLGEIEVNALRGVSLRIERGEFVAVMGASGSGKSTLMNIVGCLDRPTRGRYLLEGEDVAALAEEALAAIRSRRVGFVFQSFNLLSRTSALENVELPLFYSAWNSRGEHRAQDLLKLVGLAGREQNHPNQLSGGQQQRVAIARALINEPSILLADEPTGNLDSTSSAEIMEIITRLNREQGITVILVTHDPDIGAYADRTVSFRDGQIVSDTRKADAQPQVAAPCRSRSRRLFIFGRRGVDVRRDGGIGGERGDPAQQDALGAHDARHIHRSGGGDRDGRGRRRCARLGPGANAKPRHQLDHRAAGSDHRQRCPRRFRIEFDPDHG